MKIKLQSVSSYAKGKQIHGDKLLKDGKYDYLNGGITPSGKWHEFNTFENTITISEGGNSSGYVNYMTNPFWCGAHCYYLFDLKCDSKYLFYALKGQENKLMALRSGACMPNIKKSALGEFEFEYTANENEQKKIAAELDKISDIIAKRKSQIEKLDLLIKAKFVAMFGDPVTNQMGWDNETLEKLCETVVDCPHSTPNYTNTNTGYRCIRTSIIKKTGLAWNEIEYISESEFEQRVKRKKPQKGDIVYSREGAILGIVVIIDRECEIALGQRTMLLSPLESRCSAVFLCVAMNFSSFLNKALEKLSGSASPHINVADIRLFHMICPPRSLQTEFADFVQRVEQTNTTMQKNLVGLETLYKAKMQEYFE